MKRICILSLLIACLMSGAAAEAVLPAGLVTVEAEAFRGDTALRDITIPDGVTSIGAYAFSDTALERITIPPSVTDIAPSAFEGVDVPMLVLAEPGSAAVDFALANCLDFRAGTVLRALLIGQMAYPKGNRLDGPGKDIVKMARALEGYDVTTRTDLTAREILAAIPEAFSKAKSEDISLFYYSGHGNSTDGALVGIDLMDDVTATELRRALDKVPGRKIVVIDACFSGALIDKSIQTNANVTVDPAQAFVTAFIRDDMRSRSTLAAQNYFVMASSSGSQESWETETGGVFTSAFVKSKAQGDSDGDGVVTFEEAYRYTRLIVQDSMSGSGQSQLVQAYPEDCNWFGLFR